MNAMPDAIALDLSGWVTFDHAVERWRAYNNEFGITTYGPTADAAKARNRRAIDLMVLHLMKKGPDALYTRFDKCGAKYSVLKSGTQSAEHEKFEFSERKLLMAV